MGLFGKEKVVLTEALLKQKLKDGSLKKSDLFAKIEEQKPIMKLFSGNEDKISRGFFDNQSTWKHLRKIADLLEKNFEPLSSEDFFRQNLKGKSYFEVGIKFSDLENLSGVKDIFGCLEDRTNQMGKPFSKYDFFSLNPEGKSYLELFWQKNHDYCYDILRHFRDKGDKITLKDLVDNGLEKIKFFDEYSMYQKIKDGDADFILDILPIDLEHRYHVDGMDKGTALWIAAENGYSGLIKICSKNNANADVEVAGEYAIHWAAKHGEYLLNKLIPALKMQYKNDPSKLLESLTRKNKENLTPLEIVKANLTSTIKQQKIDRDNNEKEAKEIEAKLENHQGISVIRLYETETYESEWGTHVGLTDRKPSSEIYITPLNSYEERYLDLISEHRTLVYKIKNGKLYDKSEIDDIKQGSRLF
jgi:hypothetical protein